MSINEETPSFVLTRHKLIPLSINDKVMLLHLLVGGKGLSSVSYNDATRKGNWLKSKQDGINRMAQIRKNTYVRKYNGKENSFLVNDREAREDNKFPGSG